MSGNSEMRGVSGIDGLLHIININKSGCFSAESSPAVDALQHMTGGGVCNILLSCVASRNLLNA